MCGIAGIVDFKGNDKAVRTALKAMTSAMSHRGPDGEGLFTDGPVGLGHRRLSIIDHAGGHQPMTGPSGLTMIFNGEIYNYQQLRREMEGQGETFQTDSDTEVLLRLYERTGEACLERIVGMFAFAVWSPAENKLFLARDRLGKKPLFLFHHRGKFAFASEMKALLALAPVHEAVSLDLSAISDFLSYGYVLTPRSVFNEIKKLPAAHCATFHRAEGRLEQKEYWDLAAHFEAPRRPYDNQAKEEFDSLFDQVVHDRLHADVPLGSFLSGGVDSSVVTEAMERLSDKAPQAYCISFRDKSYDESAFAKQVADHIKAPLEILDKPEEPDLAKLVWHMDEPFADTSILPTYELNQAARKRIVVALVGDGGDEVLAGYSTVRADTIYARYRYLPGALQRTAHALAGLLLKPSYKKVSFDYKARQFLAAHSLSPHQAHSWWRTIFSEAEKARIFSHEALEQLNGYSPLKSVMAHYGAVEKADFLDQTLYLDIKTWLQDDILVKSDRMSMAHGLELRSPFLDHRLVEFCARLEGSAKVRGKRQKCILKDIYQDRLPQNILKRPKQGFNAPTRHLGGERLEPAGFENLFNPHFALNPAEEDITFKSFAFHVLNMWLKMFNHYQRTGRWEPLR